MKVPVIKKLVETYSSAQLKQAEEAIAEGDTPSIPIDGEDEGEQLTHAYAAYWIKQKVEAGENFTVALREYTQRVRQSIS